MSAVRSLADVVALGLAEGGVPRAVRLGAAVARLTETWAGRSVPAPLERWQRQLESASEALRPARHPALLTLDPPARKPLYQQAQKLIVDAAAFCVLFDPTTAALSRAKVHNVPLGPTPVVGASQVWKSG
jgi:hypothetical protein